MKIEVWLKAAKAQVSALDAELLLVWALGEGGVAEGARGLGSRTAPGEGGLTLDRSYLVAHGEEELLEETLAKLRTALERRAQGEPLAYIVGEKEFYGRKFRVDARVLIPRPETETLVDLVRERVQSVASEWRHFATGAAIDHAVSFATDFATGAAIDHAVSFATDFATVSRQSASRQAASAGRILEIGTGSGCLAVTLALELPEAEVVATDVSAEALIVAQENARRLGARVEFRRADLLAGLAGEFEVLVANLPYVDANWEWLEHRSLDYEPSGALYSEQGGLAHYVRLLEQLGAAEAKVWARWLVLEADPCQQDELARLAAAQGWRLVERRGFANCLARCSCQG